MTASLRRGYGLYRIVPLLLAALALPLQANDGVGYPVEDYYGLPDAEGITVQGIAPEGPLRSNPTETLDREEIARSGADDLGEALERATGINLLRTGGYGTVSTLSFGGFTGSRVAVYVDGIPVNSPQDGAFDPAEIDLASVDRVEVRGLSDVGSSLNSGLPGGSVSVFTAGPVETGVRLRGSLSNRAYLSSTFPEAFFTSPADTQTLRLDAEAGFGSAGAKIGGFAVRALNGFGWIDDTGTEGIREGNGVIDGGVHGALFSRLSPFTNFSVAASVRAADKGIPGSIAYDSPGNQKDARSLESVMVESKRLGRDDLAGSLSAGHTRSWLRWEDRSGTSEHLFDALTSSTRLAWYPRPSVEVDFGAQGTYTGLRSGENGNRTAFGGGATVATLWNPGRNWLVESALATVTDGDRVAPVPRLGLAWEAKPGFRVTANGYRVFRFPSFNDLYWSGDPGARGNPDLEGEEGYGGDLGFSRSEASWRLAQTARLTWYRNAIIWTSQGGVWTPDNAGEAWYLSSSTDASWSLGDAADLSLRYDWLFTRVLTGNLRFSDGKYMPYQPLHTLRAGFIKRLGDAQLSLSALYASERYTSILNLVALPPYFLLDLSAKAPIAPGLTLSVALRNAFGTSYESTEGYPMPGASVTAGLGFVAGH